MAVELSIHQINIFKNINQDNIIFNIDNMISEKIMRYLRVLLKIQLCYHSNNYILKYIKIGNSSIIFHNITVLMTF